jgi:hypothetical protein
MKSKFNIETDNRMSHFMGGAISYLVTIVIIHKLKLHDLTPKDISFTAEFILFTSINLPTYYLATKFTDWLYSEGKLRYKNDR